MNLSLAKALDMLASLHKHLESVQRPPPESPKLQIPASSYSNLNCITSRTRLQERSFNLFLLWLTSLSNSILLVNVANMMWIKWIGQFGIPNLHQKMTCFFFFFKIFFWRGPFFKVFFESATILLLFMCFGYLAMRHVGSQLPDQGSNLHLLHWKAKS